LLYKKTTQPICMQAVGRLRHERDPRKVGEGIAIAERDGPALLDTKVEDFKLPPSDPCQHIAHAVVVAKLGVLVPEGGVAGLLGPVTRLRDPRRVARDQHSTAG